MRRNRVAYLVALGVVVSASLPAAAQDQQPVAAASEQPRAVIELFTSQGCSSCPAADKLLGEYARDPSVIALSMPIDYWDYLGWKDTLAKPRHSKRQKYYAKVRGDREVYTPQAVINGVVHALGNDKSAIENSITQARRHTEALSVPVSVAVAADRQSVSVTLPKQEGTSGEVWVCAVSKSVPVAIARGENRGRTVTYANVVRRWVKVGEFAGAAHTWTVPTTDFQTEEGTDAVAVIVQAGTADAPGAVLGAATASLK